MYFFACFREVPEATRVAENAVEARCWDSPLIVEPTTAVAVWADGPGKTEIDKFAKEFLASKGAQQAQRGQEKIKSHTIAVDAMFEKMIPKDVADLSSVEGGTSFQTTAWMWAASSGMKWLGLSPNNTSMVKCLLGG